MKPENEKIPIKYSEDYYEVLINKNRIIYLYDEITKDSAMYVNSKLKLFDKEDNKKPIIIELNSGGGSVTDGLSIIDTILSIKSPVHIIATGIVASMATLILIVGDKRFAYEHTQIMQHSCSSLVGDYLNYVKDRTNFLTKLNERTINLMKKYTKFTEKEYIHIANGELWLNAKQSKKLGVIDSIIPQAK